MSSKELLCVFLFVIIVFVSKCNASEYVLSIIIIILSSIIITSSSNNINGKDSYFNKMLSKCNLSKSNTHDGCCNFKKKTLNDINYNMEDNEIETKIESILLESNQTSNDNGPENKESFDANESKEFVRTIKNPDIRCQKNVIYSEENYKYNLFDELGSLGDNKLAHKMKQISNKNREAIDNFSRTFRKDSNINYFSQELKDASASNGWWDDDAHLSTKF
jgi:hypothetical protein